MSLPAFNENGDLPVSVYSTTLEEVDERFGRQNPQRVNLTARLVRVYRLACNTGQLDRLIIFGSYITAKEHPNDVDIILIFEDGFEVGAVSEECKALLDHQQAQERFGVSLFWVRPSLIFLESLEEFVSGWQVKRDGSRRGIIEVKS